MASYLDFLKALVALGPKFPALLVILQEIVEKFQEAIRLVTGQQPLFGAAPEATAEEIDQERKLENLALQSGELHGAGERGGLREIWAFIKAHPELLTLILSLLKK